MQRLIRNFALVSALVTSFNAMASSTESVWNHHVEAWQNRDLDGILEDYNEDSILILNNQLFKGHAEIRKVFVRLFQIFDQGQNIIDTPTLVDRIVFITWHYSPTPDREFFGTDTFVVEQGKITVQTIASELYDSYPVLR